MSRSKSIRSRFNQLKSHPRWIRIPLGVFLVLGGIGGALPVLGFWMLPLGLILLSADFPWARRALAHLKLWWRRVKNRYRQHVGGATAQRRRGGDAGSVACGDNNEP